ncbi:hypothetical protein GCM10010303_11460 [Streptomyces purpurascens]|nr:hypothetical protein GCM10010303_11460 [Streptomyces purpurascens]
MTAVGDVRAEFAEMLRMLECLPAEEREGVVRALDGALRVERQAPAQSFRPFAVSE